MLEHLTGKTKMAIKKRKKREIFALGNEAVVEGALLAGAGARLV